MSRSNTFIALTLFVVLLLPLAVYPQQGRTGQTKETMTDPNFKIPPDIDYFYRKLEEEYSKDLKKTNCKTSGTENVTFTDAVYVQRLKDLKVKMEMVFNPIVKDQIIRYSTTRRKQVSAMLAMGHYYFPIFQDALKKHDAPQELKYLPVIESALMARAVSSAGAQGLWQFMSKTARSYDLEINSLVDERCDPYKSSDAAARYLKFLSRLYNNDWTLAIAAYNCGPGNVNRAKIRSGKSDFWGIYYDLPAETRSYVPIFIAAVYIMNYYEKHNICPASFHALQQNVDQVEVKNRVHFQQLADILKIDIETLRLFNPQYLEDIVPGSGEKSYYLLLPLNKLAEYNLLEDSIPNYKKDTFFAENIVKNPTESSITNVTIRHKVKSGETLQSVARKYGVSANDVKRWNKLKSTKLTKNKTLVIYKPVKKAQSETVTEKPKENPAPPVTAQNQPAAETKQPTGQNSPQDNKSATRPETKPATKPVQEAKVKVETKAEAEDDPGNNQVQAQQPQTQPLQNVSPQPDTITYSVTQKPKPGGQTTYKNVDEWKAAQEAQQKKQEQPKQETKKSEPVKSEPLKQEAKKPEPVVKQETKKTEPVKQETKKQQTKPKKEARPTQVTVKKGETLTQIAKKYDVTVDALKMANNLKSDNLMIDQKLKIPPKK